MLKSSFEYKGDVNLYLKSKDGTSKIGECHNNGYDSLFKLFAKTLAGVEVERNELPALLDIRYKYGDSSLISCLVDTIEVNRKYGFVDNKYITFIEAIVPYSSLIESVLQGIGSYTAIYLVLLNSSNEIMATTSIGYEYINRIKPGTQMLVEWRMYISNPKSTEETS